jgi:carbon monoxide dehydrogenase subunit G
MLFENTKTIQAPIERVWAMLFDPKLMAECVPGTESVETISATEFVVHVRVKVSFISARFKVNLNVVETRPPTYLRSEGSGADSMVANSFKQWSEVFLTAKGHDTTELTIKSKVDVLGRLGTFGLSIIKTKADRIWEEFGRNFAARVQATAAAPEADAHSVKS